jgi:hypothetical protein
LIDVRPGRQAARCHLVVAELDECSKAVADMQVALEQQAMQIVGRGPPGRQAEERDAEVLDALAVLVAEIDVASRRDVERNELQRRLEVVRPIGAILVARNVVVPQEMIRARRRIPKHLSRRGRPEKAEQCQRGGRARDLTAPGQAGPSLCLGRPAHRRSVPPREG